MDAYPQGRSPYGVYDMCGNVWEWTESEYLQPRNRYTVLRGGSYYRIKKGSNWYFQTGPQKVTFHQKMNLLWPGLDRCATVGFRCAADIAE